MRRYRVVLNFTETRTETRTIQRTYEDVEAEDEHQAARMCRLGEYDADSVDEGDWDDDTDYEEDFSSIERCDPVEFEYQCRGCGDDTEGEDSTVPCSACKCPVAGCKALASECPTHGEDRPDHPDVKRVECALNPKGTCLLCGAAAPGHFLGCRRIYEPRTA